MLIMLMWTNSKVSQAVEFVLFSKLWFNNNTLFSGCQFFFGKEFVLWKNLELI